MKGLLSIYQMSQYKNGIINIAMFYNLSVNNQFIDYNYRIIDKLAY